MAAPLTPFQRRRLAVIEAGLRRDRILDRRLRNMRCRQPTSAVLGRIALGLALCASLALLVAATTTSSPAWTVAFAVVWPGTLVLAAVMFRSWCRRHL